MTILGLVDLAFIEGNQVFQTYFGERSKVFAAYLSRFCCLSLSCSSRRFLTWLTNAR